jgi:hypothetical protein
LVSDLLDAGQRHADLVFDGSKRALTLDVPKVLRLAEQFEE